MRSFIQEVSHYTIVFVLFFGYLAIWWFATHDFLLVLYLALFFTLVSDFGLRRLRGGAK